MSTLRNAFRASSRQVSGAAPRIGGNLILQPIAFEGDVVEGKVLTGAAARAAREAGGELPVIKVKISGENKAKNYTSPKDKAYVDIAAGGTLRVEQVREGADGVYTSRWMKSFLGKPDASDEIIPDAVVSKVAARRRDAENRPVEYLLRLHTAAETPVDGFEALERELARLFVEHSGVTMFARDDDGMESVTWYRDKIGENRQIEAGDPAEQAANVTASLRDGAFAEAVATAMAEGRVALVPATSHRIGPDTALNIEREIAEAAEKGVAARISTIDPASFRCPGLGARLAAALAVTGDRAAPEGAGERIKEAFLKVASEADKASFHQGGWRAVPDIALRDFFGKAGISLVETPETGWSTQAVQVKKLDPNRDGIAVKAFQTGATCPLPPLELFREARAAWYDELSQAVRRIDESLRAGAPAATTSQETPAAKAETPAPAPAAPVADGGIDDIDSLLDALPIDVDGKDAMAQPAG